MSKALKDSLTQAMDRIVRYRELYGKESREYCNALREFQTLLHHMLVI